ncbi:MAG: hypothetical protein B9S33_03190 [Pedosphaera sp. Tous-C6FEB]|nr:MAG: hypothetical protein B9S33_03190 [Pedosphaera sp. Tous-C6FEB]
MATQQTQPQPVIFSYCATFLPREMLHVYRQVTGVRRFENWVLTRTRANAESFPYPRLLVLRKHPLRALRRVWYRAQGRAVPLGGGEVRQALRWAAERQARLLHIYLGSEALRALPLLRAFPGARIVSFHGADLSHEFTPADYARLWPQAELFLCRSESLRRDLLAKGCPADRIRLNYTGVPVPEDVPQRNAPAGRPVRLLQVCRLIEKKGLDVTLHATRRLRDAGVPVRLVLAGAGPAEAALRALVAELGLTKEVHFAGFVTGDALRALYRESDLFLHPSRETSRGDREGIPNSVLEAMAHALPVISTRHSGIPEAITHGVDGLLLEAADPDGLVTNVRSLLATPADYTRISQAARETVIRRFSSACCLDQLERAYGEALCLRSG